MKLIRWILGNIILFVSAITSPSAPKRSAAEQQRINERTQHLTLYQLQACPFCVKVRRAMKRLGIDIPIKTINHNAQSLEELVNFGGKRTVPCLRIADKQAPDDHEKATWLYESSDIVNYLEQQIR
jgi:glutaredoxin